MKTNRENRPLISKERKEKLFTMLKVESWEEFFAKLDSAESPTKQPQLNSTCIFKPNMPCPIMLAFPKYKNPDNEQGLAKWCNSCKLWKGNTQGRITMTEQSAKEWVGEHFHQKEEKQLPTWQPKDSNLTQEQLEAMRCTMCKSQFFKVDELEKHERTCTGV